MATEQHLNLAKDGAKTWNLWRERNPRERPDFQGALLHGIDFEGFDLTDADFRKTMLRRSSFIQTKLAGADFSGSDVAHANFRGSDLSYAVFADTDLSNANFYLARLVGANLTGANLFSTNLREATLGGTVLADTDLETVSGLEEIFHEGPSPISVDTIYRSNGNLPNAFLVGLGLPQIFIQYIPSLISAHDGIQFHSCFISYAHKDELFARHLWSRMRKARIRVWYAPEDVQGGKKLHEQIDRAIQLHDKLLVILSDTSMKSDWVQTEIRKARKQEKVSRERKLFPIRLVDFDAIRRWECFDADSGTDLATEIREYFIPDFSQWRDDHKFEESFGKLCRDLRAGGVVIRK